MLQSARAQVRACASHAGFGEDEAEDVVLAVHELAANAVRHGGGAGRLRVWNLAGALYCQVDDGDLMASAGPEADHAGLAVTEPKGSPDRASMVSLPCEPGHGLWVVQQLADQMQSLSGPGGTEASWSGSIVERHGITSDDRQKHGSLQEAHRHPAGAGRLNGTVTVMVSANQRAPPGCCGAPHAVCRDPLGGPKPSSVSLAGNP